MTDDVPTPTRAARHDGHRPRRIGLLVATVLFLGVVAAVGAAASYYQDCRSAPERRGGSVAFEVPEGASGDDVVTSLRDHGLVNCDGFVGSLLLRGTGKASELRAGTYELEVGMSLDEILTVLTTPPPEIPTVELTIVEGLRIDSPVPGREDIASVVEDQLGLSAERFVALAESGRFALPPYVKRGDPLEGFLFPKTYEFPKKELDERVVLEAMLEQFRAEAEELELVARAEELGLTPYEVVVLASMIEKEYGVDEDGPLIAGVIHNRLDEGMTLGIDATLLYQDPTPDGELSTADIETDTPYNTRINGGLTPTPIASPGAKALAWALDPAATDFLYYVLCGGDGAHRFAVTYDEHLRNVDECLG
ncbi:MAG TPA: endolytic transglycosylase MltG [Actinomycetota bacterium]|nr:endolytic transglycosylase MltG [Actinomycetota bacterium]